MDGSWDFKAFVRVPTKEQDYTESSDRRQVNDLTAHAERQGYQIVHTVQETAGRPLPQCHKAQ